MLVDEEHGVHGHTHHSAHLRAGADECGRRLCQLAHSFRGGFLESIKSHEHHAQIHSDPVNFGASQYHRNDPVPVPSRFGPPILVELVGRARRGEGLRQLDFQVAHPRDEGIPQEGHWKD